MHGLSYGAVKGEVYGCGHGQMQVRRHGEMRSRRHWLVHGLIHAGRESAGHPARDLPMPCQRAQLQPMGDLFGPA